MRPRILTFDDTNNVVERLTYSVSMDANDRYQFEILDETLSSLAIPLLVSDADRKTGQQVLKGAAE